jgi:protein-tyrosine phosphatase
MRVLVLCSANQCRSPVAAALLARSLRDWGIAATVMSAGRGPSGRPVPDPVLEAVAGMGLDLTEHLSTTATEAMVRDADLVLGMEREHVRDALVLDTGAFDRAFTLKELVRRGGAIGLRRSDEGLESWLARAAAGRRLSDLLGSARDDDVADPMGGPRRGYARAFRVLDALTGRLADLLAGV